jgi:Tfp pilus assembly protein PilF
MRLKGVFYSLIVAFGFFSCQEKNSISTEDYENLSRELFNNQQYRECLDLSIKYPSIKLNANSFELRGWCFTNLYKSDSSSYEFYKSYLLDKDNAKSLLGLSQFAVTAKSRIKYSYEYIQVVKDSLSIAAGYQRIGHNHKLEESLNLAVSSYDSSIAYLGASINDKERAYILYKKAYSQYLKRDYANALITLEKYLKIDPKRTDSKELKQLILAELDSMIK